jgi:hypothetical protein
MGRCVATTSGTGERGSWITTHRNVAAPGLAVARTRSVQTWAQTILPATTPWAVASGGVAVMVWALGWRGKGRTP